MHLHTVSFDTHPCQSRSLPSSHAQEETFWNHGEGNLFAHSGPIDGRHVEVAAQHGKHRSDLEHGKIVPGTEARTGSEWHEGTVNVRAMPRFLPDKPAFGIHASGERQKG